MQGWALASLTFAFMAVCFVLALDNTILATAIPQITSDFQSLNNIGWYGSSYLIAQMALLPTFGSVVSAVAPNSMALIIGRAVSGMGAAGLVSGTTTILSHCVPLKKQARLSLVILVLYSIGSAIGPLVGGSITDSKTLTWRFIFWLNLHMIRQLDIPGAILLLGATSCLNLALQWGGIVHPWSHPNVFGCLIGFVLLFIAFVATVPLRTSRNCTVAASCGFIMLVQVAIVLHSYYWPIYFQSVKTSSSRDSGIFLLPTMVSKSLGTIYAGWVSSKSRHYVPLMWVGAPVLAVGAGLYQLIYPKSPGQWIVFQIVSGLGYGICSQMPILAVQVVLSEADVPIGLGIDSAAVVAADAGEFRKILKPELLDAVVDAFNIALNNVFLVALAAPVLAWVVSWAMEWRRIPDTKAPTIAAPVEASEK
ncbi:MFS general substrate transporter [Colletotrichum somersetense]|nr:MFS general substrate transporter [Colletotrichum somersetense]